jgi:hypothetical protein
MCDGVNWKWLWQMDELRKHNGALAVSAWLSITIMTDFQANTMMCSLPAYNNRHVKGFLTRQFGIYHTIPVLTKLDQITPESQLAYNNPAIRTVMRIHI